MWKGFRRGEAWDLHARWYDRLPVQPVSLWPTRKLVLERIAEVCPDARWALDMGCGIGQLAFAMASAFPNLRVLAVDPSRKMVERAARDQAHPRVEYRRGFVEEVPTDPPFDLVVCTHALPYIEDPVAFLRQLRDRMRPGAVLLLAQACTEHLRDRLLLRLVQLTTGPADYAPSARVKGWMQQAGLRPRAIHPIPTIPGMASLRLLEAVRP